MFKERISTITNGQQHCPSQTKDQHTVLTAPSKFHLTEQRFKQCTQCNFTYKCLSFTTNLSSLPAVQPENF